MAKQRIQVQGPEPLGINAPVARPVSLFAGAQPYTPKQFLTDFSGLSDTLGRVAEINTQDRNKQGEADALAALADPEFREALKAPGDSMSPSSPYQQKDWESDKVAKKFNKLVQSGKISETQSPVFWETVYKTSAQDMVAQYRRDVYARMDEATTSLHPEKSIEQIQQEVWEQYKDHPSIKNYFGSQEAGRLVPQVNQELSDHASRKYQEMARVETRRSKTQEAIGMLSAAKDIDWSPETLAAFEAKIDEWYKGNIADPRGLFADALKAHLTRLEAVSPTMAKDALENAMNIKVAGVPLGEDAQLAAELNDRLTRLTRAAEQEADAERLRMDGKRSEAIQIAGNYALSTSQKLQDAGASTVGGIPQAIEDLKKLLEDKGLSQLYPEARDHLESIMRREHAEGSEAKYQEALGSIENGTMDYTKLSTYRNQVSVEQYRALHDAMSQKEIGLQALNSPVWSSAVKSINELRGTYGLSGDIDTPFVQDFIRELEQEFIPLAQAADTNPEAQKEVVAWRGSVLTKARERFQARQVSQRTAYTEFMDKARTAQYSHLDNSEDIYQALAAGIITDEQAQPYLARASQATSWEWMNEDPEVRSGLAGVERTVESFLTSHEVDKVAPASIPGEQVKARELYRAAFRESFIAARAQGDGFKNADQRHVAVIEANKQALTAVAKAFGMPEEIMTGTPESIAKATEGYRTFLDSNEAFKKEVVAYGTYGPEGYTTELLPVAIGRSPVISQKFRDVAVAAYSRNRLWSATYGVGTPGATELTVAARDELDRIIGVGVDQTTAVAPRGAPDPAKPSEQVLWSSRPKQPSPEATKAALSVMSFVGLPPQALLDGQVEWLPTVQHKGNGWTSEYIDPTSPIALKLDGKNTLGMQTRINFKSETELLDFIETNRDKIPQMAKALGIPAESMDQFFDAQKRYLEMRPR